MAIPINSPINPLTTQPVTDAVNLNGGFTQVADNTARDAIYAPRRTSGMYVSVWNGGGAAARVYRYDGATGAATNGAAWVNVTSATSDGAQTFTAAAATAVGAINVRTTGHLVAEAFTKPIAVFQASPGAGGTLRDILKLETIFNGDNPATSIPSNTRLNGSGGATFDIAINGAPYITLFGGNGTTDITGALIVNGDLAVQGGDFTTTATTFNFLTSVATIVNLATGASASLVIGHASAPATMSGGLSIPGGKNIALSTTTGTKLGTGPTQLLAFYGATAVDQPAAVADAGTGQSTTTFAEVNTDLDALGNSINSILARLRELGLIAT